MRRFSLLLAVLAVLLSGTAFAQKSYFGVDYIMATYSEDGVPDADLGLLGIKVGGEFNEYFAAEARLGFGVQDDTVGVDVPGFGTVDVNVEADYFLGAYMRGMLPFEVFTPYLLIGITQAELTVSAWGYSASEDDSDLSFGVGTDVKLSEQGALNIEFTKLMDESDYDVTAISFGFKMFF